MGLSINGPNLEQVRQLRPPATEPETSWRRGDTVIACAIVIVYFLLTVGNAMTARPDGDEAGFTSPAFNLVHNSGFRTTLYEPRGFFASSLPRGTYWYPPLYFLALAAWGRVCGFGIVQVRLLSTIWGLLALFSWYLIFRAMRIPTRIALLGTAFISLDYFFVLGSSWGRMDIMCASLGTAGLAVYLQLRTKSIQRALFYGNALVAMSGLTHPAGIVYLLALAVLIVRFDRKSLSWRLISVALIPYFIGGAAWGLYIARDPAAFVEQFFGTMRTARRASGVTGQSFLALILRSVQHEVYDRWMSAFGLRAGVHGLNRLKALVLVTYWGAFLGAIMREKTRKDRELIALLLIAFLNFALLAAISPSKNFYYLPHMTTYLAATAFVFVLRITVSGTRERQIGVTILVFTASLQIGGVLYRIRENTYKHDFVPTIALIKNSSPSGALIIGPGELWFGLEPQRVVLQDGAYGYLSGRRPALFVMDDMFRNMENSRDPASPESVYMRSLLAKSKLVYQNNHYDVYRPTW